MSITSAVPHSGAERGRTEARLRALGDAVAALTEAQVPYLLMGGLGAAVQGRPRMTEDVDFFVSPADGRPALDALEGAGFSTEERNPRWLFKAWKYDILVDVIFRSSGDVYIDDEMLRRGRPHDIGGFAAQVMASEDIIVIKAITADEHVAHHWYDALALLASADLDWAYLARRARQHGLRRTTSLLLYAESKDIYVPPQVTSDLFHALRPDNAANPEVANAQPRP